MGKPVVRTWKDCRDPRVVLSFAQRNGVRVESGRGDHVKLEYKGHHETLYTSRELSIGVAREVWKFFLRVGLVAMFVAAVAALW